MRSCSSLGALFGVAQDEERRERNFYRVTGLHWEPGSGHGVRSNLLFNTALPGSLHELPEGNVCVFN